MSKHNENRKAQLGDTTQKWDTLYKIVHNKNLVMYKRKCKNGKVIRYLDNKKV